MYGTSKPDNLFDDTARPSEFCWLLLVMRIPMFSGSSCKWCSLVLVVLIRLVMLALLVRLVTTDLVPLVMRVQLVLLVTLILLVMMFPRVMLVSARSNDAGFWF